METGTLFINFVADELIKLSFMTSPRDFEPKSASIKENPPSYFHLMNSCFYSSSSIETLSLP
jgi:hypothetical protein